MTKTWETKKKIINLVSGKAKTPQEISESLNLAPSTVSEHVAELESMGALRRVDNPFVKKWKYYEKNPNFDINTIRGPRRLSLTSIAIAVVAILGLLAFVAVVYPASGSGSVVLFQLTDPPQVPNGTQALTIAYSSVQAHVIDGNQSGWVTGSGSGTINLMSLINTSQVIGTGKIPTNAVINIVRFNITSATIVINGTAYNVTVPSGVLSTTVTGAGRVSQNSSVLIDMSPIVVSIFTQNTTTFVLVPSVKAVFVGNSNITARVGVRANLTGREHQELEAATPSINITSASVVVTGNTTSLSITVRNTGNRSVMLRHLMLVGGSSVLVSANSMVNSSVNASVDINNNDQVVPNFQSANVSLGVISNDNSDTSSGASSFDTGSGSGINISSSGSTDHGMNSHEAGSYGAGIGAVGNSISSLATNLSANTEGTKKSHELIDEGNGLHLLVTSSLNTSVGVNASTHSSDNGRGSEGASGRGDNVDVNALINVGRQITMFRNLNFMIAANGSLELPFLHEVENSYTGGYLLAPNATVTLRFSGQIMLGEGHILVVPVVNSTYQIDVVGEDGAFAHTNATATAG